MKGQTMTDVTQILSQIEQGDPKAADELLPLVYDELRKLAAAKMAQENPGQTLQATALVHEAYVRLVDVEKAQHWDSRGHFYVAAAEAMRRILVESARRKSRKKHGGEHQRCELADDDLITYPISDELLDLGPTATALTDILVRPEGDGFSILTFGHCRSEDGNDFAISRLLPDGTPDLLFGLQL